MAKKARTKLTYKEMIRIIMMQKQELEQLRAHVFNGDRALDEYCLLYTSDAADE